MADLMASFDHFAPSKFFLRSLRRERKPALASPITASLSVSLREATGDEAISKKGLLRYARKDKLTTFESTFGGGLNAPGPTLVTRLRSA